MSANDKYYYQYEFNIKVIIPGVKDPIVPVRLKRAMEESLYHEKFYPYLQLFCEFKREDVMTIYRNQLKSYFQVTRKVMKFLMTNPNADSTVSEPEMVSQDTDLDEIFVPLYREDDFPTDIRDEDYENRELRDGDGVMAYRVMDTITHELDIILYSAKALAANKDSLINAVFKDCTVGTAVGFIIDNSSCETAIVDKPDNDIKYKNLILLPYNLRNSLWSLQYRYGLYKDSLIAFFDFECLYILNKFATSHEYAPGDKPRTIIEIHDKPETFIQPCLIGESKNAMEYIVSVEPKRIDQKAVMGELEGAKTMVTNYQIAVDVVTSKDGEVTGYNNAAEVLSKQAKAHEKSGDKISLEYDEMNNLINIQAYNRERSPKECLTFAIGGAEAKSFKPNKIIQLRFTNTRKNQELGGDYSVSTLVNTYVPIDQRHNRMICNASIALIKLNDD